MTLPVAPSVVTLYVDGACRGNPGLGGWGALIEQADGQKQELWGGEHNTTNNRMELTAAIEGIKALDAAIPLRIWTDSSYVQKGMSEWLAGWKKKNWRKADGKPVINADLWQQLDVLCQNRVIDWRWIKGHAGHAGNERADQLANRGADKMTTPSQKKNSEAPSDSTLNSSNGVITQSSQTHSAPDWLSHDPLGLDFMNNSMDDSQELDESSSAADFVAQQQNDTDHGDTDIADLGIDDAVTDEDWIDEVEQHSAQDQVHKAQQLVDDPASHGVKRTFARADNADGKTSTAKRQLILDTETTGFSFKDGDRVIEVGVIEMINRKLTGSSFHVYLNPQRLVGDSENVHGLSDKFLADKPLFDSIAQELSDYLNDAEIIAHNANFDMSFLEGEFSRAGIPALKGRVIVTDTLALAKRKHPGQKNSLDALARRYEIKQRDRTFHGALLDAEILADVYLSMTGGQVTLDIGHERRGADGQSTHQIMPHATALPVILASDSEQQIHDDWLAQFEKKNGLTPLWQQS
jgi:ribonuclease HI/DNA polymerase-3 subunit epsilon